MSGGPVNWVPLSGAVLSNLRRDTSSGSYGARAHFPSTAAVFQGHFPGDAIAPGYCLLNLILDTLMAGGHALEFKTIDWAKFYHPVLPGDVLDVDIHIQPHAAGGFACEATLRLRDQLILDFSGSLAESQNG